MGNFVSPATTLVFIDGAIADESTLTHYLQPGVEVVLLNSEQDGIQQISDTLAGRLGVESVQIFSHGAADRLYLGSTELSTQNLGSYAPQISQWASALSETADLMLYGCDVAANGTALIEQLRELTGADVAASNDRTGTTGDWDLEVHLGAVHATSAIQAKGLAAYSGTLNVITVTTTADQGAGSLRAAIAQATDGTLIRFASNLANQTLTLTSGELAINQDITLDATGVQGITLSGNLTSRVLHVGDGASVTLKGLTLTNGRVRGADDATGAGGAILTGMDSRLTVVDCRLTNNAASQGGGGIYTGYRGGLTVLRSYFEGNDGSAAGSERGGGAIASRSEGFIVVRDSRFVRNRGINGGAINSLLKTLTVENSIFLNNDSTPGRSFGTDTRGYGGAIYTDGAEGTGGNAPAGSTGGVIRIRNSRFEGNRGAGQGGGLFLFAYPPDQVVVEGCLIRGNTVIRGLAGDALGGGLRQGNSALTLRNTTFANNRAFDQGGGLWIGEQSPTTILNSTFSNNVADDGNGNGLGAAITIATGKTVPTVIRNSTLAYNRAGFMGGAFWFGEQPVTLANSIVANNTGGNPWGTNQQTGRSLRDGGGNIQFPALLNSGDVRVTATARIINPRLGALADNGGLAPTHRLLAGSPAINTGVRNGVPLADQRGVVRDNLPDVGAVEAIAGVPTFRGTAQADTLRGTASRDVLAGLGGNDRLMGGTGGDTLMGGIGADQFAYIGNSQAGALAGSRLARPDWIRDWRPGEGDRLLLDYGNGFVRPTGVFNAGLVTGSTLPVATQAAFTDKNQAQAGQQGLQAHEAVLFRLGSRRYLAINDAATALSATADLVVDVTGIGLTTAQQQAGRLPIAALFA